MKKIILIFLIFFFTLQAQAFEDVILSAEEKISNIKIEEDSIINVNHLTTIQNKKNILFILPKREGKTKLFLTKKNKQYVFEIEVKKEKTYVEKKEDFEIVLLDTPPSFFDYQIDIPPIISKKETINIDGATIEINSERGEDNG